MTGNAEIILVRRDGALILQRRDDKPGITNPGAVTTFGGHIEPGEQPVEAAKRELEEETGLVRLASELEFFGKYQKTKAIHGEDWDVYYFIARDVDPAQIDVREGQGFVVVQDLEEVQKVKTSILLKQVASDYFSKNGKL